MTRYWLEFLALVIYCTGARTYYLFLGLMRHTAQIYRWKDVDMDDKQFSIFCVFAALIWPLAATLMFITPDWTQRDS